MENNNLKEIKIKYNLKKIINQQIVQKFPHKIQKSVIVKLK